MTDTAQQLLNEALATNIEAISSVPKPGDSLVTLAKKEARTLRDNEHAIKIANTDEFSTSNTEMYHVAATWPSVLAKEGATGVVAIRATIMALYGNAHAHNVSDVAKGLETLSKLPALLKTALTPYEAWAVYKPIVQVIQGKLDYMASRKVEPKTAPNTPPKRARDDDHQANKDGGAGGRGGGGGQGRGGRGRRSWPRG